MLYNLEECPCLKLASMNQKLLFSSLLCCTSDWSSF